MKAPGIQRARGFRALTRGMTAAAVVAAATLGISACTTGDSAAPTSASTTTSTEAVIVLPTRAELNDVLARLLNPDLPFEEKALTVEDGFKAGDYFGIVTDAAKKQELGFDVIDPVTPGYTTKEAIAGVNVLRPGVDPVLVDQVSFLYRDGRWLLSKDWACTLATMLAPEHKPGFCLAPGEVPPPPNPPAQPAEEPAQAPEGAPVPPAPPAGEDPAAGPAPVPEPAPAPEGAPAPPPVQEPPAPAPEGAAPPA